MAGLIKRISLPPDLREEEVEVVRQAIDNQESSRKAVRALLERRPDLAQAVGTRVADLEQFLIERASGALLDQEAIRAELRSMRASMQQDGDGTAERLLIEHAAICWLALCSAQMLREQRRADGVSHASADAWDRHVSRLQTDFLRVVKTLATVRRLRLPSLQVNVANQQVNVAG